MNWSTKSQYSTERGQSLLPLAAFRSRQWNPFQAGHHNGEATRWLDGINPLSRNRYLPLRSFFLTELAVTLIHHDHTGATATVLLLMHKHGAKVLKIRLRHPFSTYFLANSLKINANVFLSMTNCRSQEMYQKTFADVTFCGFWYIFVDTWCFFRGKAVFIRMDNRWQN